MFAIGLNCKTFTIPLDFNLFICEHSLNWNARIFQFKITWITSVKLVFQFDMHFGYTDSRKRDNSTHNYKMLYFNFLYAWIPVNRWCLCSLNYHRSYILLSMQTVSDNNWVIRQHVYTPGDPETWSCPIRDLHVFYCCDIFFLQKKKNLSCFQTLSLKHSSVLHFFLIMFNSNSCICKSSVFNSIFILVKSILGKMTA